MVAIEKTQFETKAKLKPKNLGPYEITEVKQKDRYVVNKVGQHDGPYKTSTAAEKMKPWATLKTMKATNQPITIFVEGNIGAGKSTLLDFFTRFDDIEILPEPVEDWQDVNGHNLLRMYYENPQRYGFVFQSYAFLTMLKQHLKPCTKYIKIMERSLLSSQHCFAKNLQNRKIIDDISYEVLKQWFNFLTNQFNLAPNYIIYLRTTPSTIINRIEQRGRQEEKSIKIDYLNDLHSLHETWMKSIQNDNQNVITIDGNLSKQEIEQETQRCLFQIKHQEGHP